jgi:hypothetical protein
MVPTVALASSVPGKANVRSLWKSSRAKALNPAERKPGACCSSASIGVGLLSGGYGQEELERAGAARVYEAPADLLRHVDEIGSRR